MANIKWNDEKTLILKGHLENKLPVKEIAAHMGFSLSAIKSHIKDIQNKPSEDGEMYFDIHAYGEDVITGFSLIEEED